MRLPYFDSHETVFFPPRPSRFMPRGNTHMLDFMSSPQSMERPTMTVPSLAV
jgi:hypothetical protein